MAASVVGPPRGSLSLPNVKFLAYHLKMASIVSQTGGRSVWACTYNNIQTMFSLTWVQGTVIHVHADEEQVVIKDDSGKIKLVEAKMNTSTIEDLFILKPGQYVMAVGELVENVELPTIKTHKLKIMEEGREELAALWPLEVQHQLKYAATHTSA